MRDRVFVSFGIALTALVITRPLDAQTEQPLAFSACYAPGTPWSRVMEHANVEVAASAIGSSLVPPAQQMSPGGPEAFAFVDGDRWSTTATDGGGLQQGDPTTLTWSIVPDGTSVFGYVDEPTANSTLRAFLDSIYGSEAVWLPIFQSVFDRWASLNGVTYVYEPNDDGDPWTSTTIAAGALGVRGDIRIAGHPIDGDSGILAYNFFPDFGGDMVIDTPDSFYNNTSDGSLRLRNVLAHEHGHGLGLSHSCPIEQTKLMEPFLTTAFDGPQHDDILASNRGYGDTNEHNDVTGSSTALGAFVGSQSENGRSIDDNGDADFFSFAANAEDTLDVTLTPVGSTYLAGPQRPNGSCSRGTLFNSLIQNDMGLEILDTDGISTLAMSTSNPAGVAESVSNQLLTTSGTYFVRVIPGFDNAAQLYDVIVTLVGPTTPPTTSWTFTTYDLIAFFTDTSTGRPSAWSWDFGDTNTSTSQNPSYFYQSAGTRTVSMTASNTIGSGSAVDQSVGVAKRTSMTMATGGTVDLDGDGNDDLQAIAQVGCAGDLNLRVINGSTWAGASEDYRTVDGADIPVSITGTSDFCSADEVAGLSDTRFVQNSVGDVMKFWTPEVTGSLIRLETDVVLELCGASFDVDLVGINVLGVDIREACNDISASTVVVMNGGDLTLRAGNSVVLRNGFKVESGGSLSVFLEVPTP